MKSVLQINSSIFGEEGQSTQLANLFVANYKQNHANIKHIVRDLSAEPVAHYDASRIAALSTPAEQRTDAQNSVVDYTATLIEEIQSASIIVLALPMYNFGIPSTMKAYFDHIAQAGKTFKYTDNGPVGLLNDRPVYVIATRGGKYFGTPLDTQTSYLKSFMAFLGINDLRFVYAEGLNMGNNQREEALKHAQSQLVELAVGS